MKQIRSKKLMITLLLVLLLFLSIVLPLALNKTNAHAEAITDDQICNNDNDNEIQPMALTTLSISINGGDNKVWATVRNDFTLFPSTVIVVVELYSSLTYTDNYNNMTLAAINSIDDLDMGHTIVAEASTGGVDKYWIARMRYKTSKNGSWQAKATGVCKISATGEFLGYI